MTRDPDAIDAEFEKGFVLGRYRIEEPVGQGGMGTVYAAFDGTTNRMVAIKVLAPGISEPLRERFLAECEAQARIRHPHVMPVYDQGWYTDDRPYFVMELLYDPITLGDIVGWIQDGSLSRRHPRLRHLADPRRLIQDVFLPIARGIAAANREYVVQHRDLKPDNVLLDVRTRRAYVIDFGICRPMDDDTPEGKIVGTPRFLSTEQASGRVDPRTDVWGLGAILHYVLSGDAPLEGSSPFSRKDVAARIAALQEAEANAKAEGQHAKSRGFASRRAQLEDPAFRTLEDLYGDARSGTYLPLPESLPPALVAIVRQAMAPRPAERYEDAYALVADLETWLEGGSVRALATSGTTTVAVDKARRAIQRNLVTAGAAAVALVAAALLGRLVFAKPTEHPNHRQADAAEAEARLSSRLENYARLRTATALDWQRAATQWHDLQGALASLATRGPEAAAQAKSLRRAHGLRPRLLDLGSGSWEVRNLADVRQAPVRYEAGKTRVHPGLWFARRIQGQTEADPRQRILIPVSVPAVLAPGDEPLRVGVAPLPEDRLTDMVWVAGDDEDGGPFLAMRGFVTNGQYAEWLDELPGDERSDHVPPAGFHQGDPSDETRWITVVGVEDRPVVGLRPASILGYAAWWAQARGLPLRVPTAAEWQRLAGGALLAEPLVREAFLAGWKRSVRRRPHAVALTGALVRGRPADPVEVVLDGDAVVAILPGNGEAFLGGAVDASPTGPYTPSTRGGVFRLILPLAR